MKNQTLTAEQIEIIKEAIKNCGYRWDKSSYAYAIGGMDRYNAKSLYYEEFKKQEILDEFFKLLPDNFWKISNFTTFQNIKF